jgi:MoaA/NifB/PqqE/SkfB family radical SAM enzyme
VSCDFWQSDGASDLTRDEIGRLATELAGLGTRVVVFTGGEPLFRPDVVELAELFRARGIALHLLTSGIALGRFAADVARLFADVTVSLDGHSAEQYQQIRGVDGLGALARGLEALRAQAPALPVSARSTLHRHNFRQMGAIIETARTIGIARLSFLAADVEPSSFNRDAGRLPRAQEPPSQALLLSADEVREFGGVVETVIREHASALAGGSVSPGPVGLRRLVQYYGAHLRMNPFPPVDCNAPWMSVYIAADGAVRPCFFHPPVGNVRTRSLREIVTVAMPAFRRRLDVATDATCQRCICNVKTGLRTRLW